MTIAFFDIDRTLLSANSAKLWVRHELKRGAMRRRTAARGALWMALYGLGATRLDGALRAAALDLIGQPEAPLIEEVERFYRLLVRPTIRDAARRAVEAHRQRSEPVVLLTSSSNYIAELLREELGAQGYSSNRLLTDESGRFDGRFDEPLCFGAGKIWHARRWAERFDVPLQRCAFYTDSYSDLPLLKLVRSPRVVSPDPRLRREARRQGWPLLDWDREEPSAS